MAIGFYILFVANIRKNVYVTIVQIIFCMFSDKIAYRKGKIWQVWGQLPYPTLKTSVIFQLTISADLAHYDIVLFPKVITLAEYSPNERG